MCNAHELQPRSEPQAIIVTVLQDILDRAKDNKKKYGTVLKTHNGRDALWDAYQQAIDMVMYLRQAILEREMNVIKQKELH